MPAHSDDIPPDGGPLTLGRALEQEMARLERAGNGLAVVCVRLAGGDGTPSRALLGRLHGLAACCDTAAPFGDAGVALLLPGLDAAQACAMAVRALERAREGGEGCLRTATAAWATLGKRQGHPDLRGEAGNSTPHARPEGAGAAALLERMAAALDGIPSDGRVHRMSLDIPDAGTTLVGAEEKRFLFSARPLSPAGEEHGHDRHDR